MPEVDLSGMAVDIQRMRSLLASHGMGDTLLYKHLEMVAQVIELMEHQVSSIED